ncbi:MULTISPECIES: aldehyde dehydrogenase family protein [Pseudomonas]|uniref:4-hydroxybenzaldehyde dehydrogenase (NADP(+)) n=1 Tax=Pseudomonas fluorescens TaxID=294 RepID=A0A5E7RLA6_PSEFL|nr:MULTISPECIES: aldehyde dehydrogenase family protein [Pseudomonas]VVP74899.1 4-hydroxybenzaldehyde dehydrogenase (NADP(+)) [Pseudomonas fluorescens]
MLTALTTPYTIDGLQFIAGAWRTGRSSRCLSDRNPFNGELLLEIPQASVADLDDAYKAAEHAQHEWNKTAAQDRRGALEKLAQTIESRSEEIIGWLIRESGSTRIKATFEWHSTLGMVRECAGMPFQVEGRILTSYKPGEQSYVFREPLGVVGVISPWNFPLYLSMRSVVPAIALGNAVVLKPASDTAVTGGLLIAKLFEEAGFPKGLLNVVVGAGSEIGDAFVAHPIPSLISFTGSTDIGRNVGRIGTGGQHIKRVALELGGNSPLVVLDDADLEAAAHAAVVGRFLHQGQICMSTNRVIVDRSVYGEFAELITARVKKLKVGDPEHADTVIGPVINDSQLKGLQRKIDNARNDGIKLLHGAPSEGLLVPPHLFGDVDGNHELVREETFGPLLPLVIAQNQDHALQLANASEYGLSSAVFTRDMSRGLAFARGIVAGMTHINDMTVDDQPNAPFGGEKNSGLGRFNGHYALDEFTRAHWVTWRSDANQYPF